MEKVNRITNMNNYQNNQQKDSKDKKIHIFYKIKNTKAKMTKINNQNKIIIRKNTI